MSKTLILFSGGVESTALLTTAGPNDILVTIKPIIKNYIATYNPNTVEKIASYYNKKINYVTINIPSTGNNFVHQIWYFVSIASLWVARDPSITSVVSGRHSKEPTPENKPAFDILLSAWNVMHPTVPFLFPNGHLTKLEQWNMIPADVKPLVSSCFFTPKCGTCHKCKEVKELIYS